MAANAVVSLTVDVTTMKEIRRHSQQVKKAFFELSKDYDLALCTDASYKDGIGSIGITDGCDRWLYRVDNYIDHNVAEMVGIVQALRLALSEFRHPKRLLIGSDSLTVLSGFQSAYEKGQTNQYTVAINFGLSWFYETCEITLMWIPGHKGIPLNEIADETARIARQLPEESALSFPLSIWSKKTRWSRRSPSDLLHYQPDSKLAKQRDADSILRSMELQQSPLNCDHKVPGYPEFAWCELCLALERPRGRTQTPHHVFMECKALESERNELRTEFLTYGIPYELQTIFEGYCIEQTAAFLDKLQKLKASHVI